MDKIALIEEIRKLIQEVLGAGNFEFIDLIYRYEGRDLFLRVLADRPEGGITLEECARLNKEIGFVIEEKNILQQRYILEVSSPGLDRPLQTRKDFLRCLNRRVRVFLREAVEGRWEWEGSLIKVDPETLRLDTEMDEIELPLSKVARGKQVVGSL
jgi:ribosome maturation factor RimP